MDKQALLKLIAEKGYDVGFGAKKHFASYDIICKMPYWISFFVLAVGVVQIGYPNMSYNKEISIGLIIVSVASLFLNVYSEDKDKYDSSGKEITSLFNSLKKLYMNVKSSSKTDYTEEIKELNKIESDFYSVALSKQVFMADCYAHIKFFYQFNIDWIDEQQHFKFLKDKVPGSLRISIKILISLFIIAVITAIIIFSICLLYCLIKHSIYEYITNIC